MARIIANKYPIDLEARKAVGFSLPLNGKAVFKPTYNTRDQIKTNLLNYLLTDRGERVFNTNFGANLRSLLFENIVDDTLDDLEDTIKSAINDRFPDIVVRETNFDNQSDENRINFTLKYDIVTFGVTDDLTIALT